MAIKDVSKLNTQQVVVLKKPQPARLPEKQLSDKTPLAIPIIIGFLTLFAGLFSWFFLSGQSLRLDEAQSLWQTSHTSARILTIIAQDVHVPLYHLMLHVWQILFGNAVATGRIFSLLFFLPTIPALYILGRNAYDRNIALFGTILFALSPFLNWYGSEIRMYSLLTFITVLNQIFYTRLINNSAGETETASKRKVWIGYAITALLGMYTHYFFLLILISQVVFYFLKSDWFPKKSFRNFSIIAILLGAMFAPWLLLVKSLGSASGTQPQLTKPTSVNFFNTFSQFLFGFQNDRINTILVSLWPATVLLGFLSLRKRSKAPPHSFYFFLSFFLPIAIAFILSLTLKPVFLSRYLIIVVPSLYLFLSWILATFDPKVRKVLQVILVTAFVITLGQQTISASTPVKEDYKTAVEYIQQKATAQDAVILSAPFTIYPIEYYYRGQAKLTTLPLWDRFSANTAPGFDESKLPEQVASLTATKRQAYVLLSFNQGYEDTIRFYFDTHYERIDTKEFSQGLSLYVYQLRYDIPQ